MRTVDVGVWGVGVWGEKHARVYHSIHEARLVGVHDRDPARARAVAEQYGCRAFDRAQDLLDECEAVSIAVPTIGHREALEQAAAAKRHALVEKPLAPSVADADAMIQAAQRAGIVFQVGQVERFNPVWRAARSAITRVKFIEAHRLALFQPRSLDVDVVFDLMIHDIDLVLDCVSAMPATVSAVGVAVLSRNQDIANARLEFADGSVANLTASRVSQDRLRRIRFFQADAYVSLDLFERTGDILEVKRPTAGAKPAPDGGFRPGIAGIAPPFGGIQLERRRLEAQAGEPLALELEAFLRSVRGEGPGAASGEAGRAALAVAAQVRAAMEERALLWDTRPSPVT